MSKGLVESRTSSLSCPMAARTNGNSKSCGIEGLELMVSGKLEKFTRGDSALFHAPPVIDGAHDCGLMFKEGLPG